MFFREGVFFIYHPLDSANGDISRYLLNRERVIKELLGRRIPSMTSLCVLVADLQDSVKISAELPPADYFSLINQIWNTLSASFEKYHGICGKHAGDGLLYYFLKNSNSDYILNAINCALDLREKLAQFSNEWKVKKGWINNLYLNIGINAGKEFFGSICTPIHVEYTALGDTINYAARLSDFASFGSIWVTKNVLNQLNSEELSDFYFGIKRRDGDREIFIKKTYSRILDLVDHEDPRLVKFKDISTVPVTEIVGKV
jgi:class 3 adenylate cyclase